MMIHDITAKVGANRKTWRVGRGMGSGSGKTSGRGHKGAGARAGFSGRTLNEGGALPLFRRVPIRGFSNFRFQTQYQPVNLSDLDAHFAGGAEVSVQSLVDIGLARLKGGPVKVLGNGTLSKKLKVTADAFSDSAARKITDAGGEVNDLSGRLAVRAKARARAEIAAKAKAEAAAKAKAEAEAKAKAKADAKAKGKEKGEGKGKPEGKAEGQQPKGEKKKKEPKKQEPGA